MQVRVDTYKNIKGMQQDNSLASFNKDSQLAGQYVYENYNMRLTAHKENTANSFTNDLTPLPTGINFHGEVLATCVAENKLVVFTLEDSLNKIYTVSRNSDDTYNVNLLYSGDLNMSSEHPIKTKFFFENNEIQKVYWIDGYNQNRFINIAATEKERSRWTERTNPFDFVPELNLLEQVNITKNNDTSGEFAPGVLQYFMTYANYYGQESNIFYASPLLYTSNGDRAGMQGVDSDGSLTSVCPNSFTIEINNAQVEYDYIRIYSILRTALNDTPQAKLVAELRIAENTINKEVAADDQYYYIIDTASDTKSPFYFTSRNAGVNDYTFYKKDETDNIYYKLDQQEKMNLLGGIKDITPVNAINSGKGYVFSCDEHPDILIYKKTSLGANGKVIQLGDQASILCSDNPGVTLYFLTEISSSGPASGYYYMIGSPNYDVLVKCYEHAPQLVTVPGKVSYITTVVPITFTDTGTVGKSIVPTDLFYLGGTPCSASAFEQKDNTLFLGDIKTERFSDTLEAEVQTVLQTAFNKNIKFQGEKSMGMPPLSEYPYKSQLDYNSYQYKTFKYGETYRLGLQFQDKYGKWSNVIFLKDTVQDHKLINNSTDSFVNNVITWRVPQLSVSPDTLIDDTTTLKTYIQGLYDRGYRKIRPVIVYPEFYDRTCVTQGLVCPTVFNVEDRNTNSPYVQASWFFRPNAGNQVNSIHVVGQNNKLLGYTGFFKFEIETSQKSTCSVISGRTVSFDLYGHTYYGTVVNVTGTTNGDGTHEYSKLSIVVTDYTVAPLKDESIPFTLGEFNSNSVIKGVHLICSGYQIGYFTMIFNEATAVSDDTIALTKPKSDNTYFWKSGAFLEHRHLIAIPGTRGYASAGSSKANEDASNMAAAEIQCIETAPKEFSSIKGTKLLDDNNSEVTVTDTDMLDAYQNVFYIDSSIVTLNSPDLIADEKFKTIEPDGLKFRIVGYAPLQATTSNVSITAGTPETTQYYKEPYVNYASNPPGFLKRINANQNPYIGGRVFNNGALWWDEVCYRKGSKDPHSNSKHIATGFVIYPWHKSNSLNNSRNRTGFVSEDEENVKYQTQFPVRSGSLKYKIMANTRVSQSTVYLDDMWYPTVNNPDIKVFSADTQTLIKIDSNDNKLNYYGNVNKILFPNNLMSSEDTYPLMVAGKGRTEYGNSEYYESLEDYVGKSGTGDIAPSAGLIKNNSNQWSNYSENILVSVDDGDYYDVRGTDGVLMKYKSTPHFVVNFSDNTEYEECLPYLTDEEDYIESFSLNNTILVNPHSRTRKAAQIKGASPNAYLWIGELYRDTVNNRFGGDTTGALEANIWLPCGNGVSLDYWLTNTLDKYELTWEEGDTYYQRFDCVKTYPYTTEDQNQLYETVSFMVESINNLDGRYDINRGNSNSLAIQPGVNFNLFNAVYSQKNNFFTYTYNNPNKVVVYNFPNQITWSETKINGSLTDAWSCINLVNTMDLDGDKGSVTSLNKVNNQLFSVLEHGISKIKYNENVQITPDNGLPVQLANSGKVDGKEYISEQVGCQDNLKIQQTEKAVYFIDDNLHGFFGFDAQNVVNISLAKGFSSTFKNAVTTKMLYDKYTGEIHIHGNYDGINSQLDNCTLAFNENINEFVSFYSYGRYKFMDTVEGIPYTIGIESTDDAVTSQLCQMYAGAYANDYYTIFIVNPSPNDKIFNTLEFNADVQNLDGTLSENCPFTNLDVWNEYQYGTLTLTNKDTRTVNNTKVSTLSTPTSLKQRFRLWRALIPRHNVDWKGNTANFRARIRNPWVYLKLKGSESSKIIFHDLNVYYYE